MTLYNPQDSAISRWVYDRLGRITNSEITDASGTTVEADYNYDPLGRLYEVAVVGGDARRYLWDGSSIIAEYDTSGNVTERYAYRPGSLGAPVVIFSGAGAALGDRHIVQTDERGSVLSIADALLVANSASRDVNCRVEHILRITLKALFSMKLCMMLVALSRELAATAIQRLLEVTIFMLTRLLGVPLQTHQMLDFGKKLYIRRSTERMEMMRISLLNTLRILCLAFYQAKA